MSSTVRVPWNRDSDNGTYWREVCTWAIKYFGAPGDRFQICTNVNFMDFAFESNKDALLMAVRWGGQIIPDEQLTIDYVGSMMQ